MGNGNIILRKVRADDCEDLYHWRNDEETRKANFNSEPIDYKTHRNWFEASLKNPNRYIYIAEDQEGNKIGVVRLDKRNERVAEFDINLSPEMRGKGYGVELIRQACKEVTSDIYLARVKHDNPASVKAFKKAGFFEMFDYVDARWGGVVVLAKLLREEFGDEGEVSSYRGKTPGNNKNLEKFGRD